MRGFWRGLAIFLLGAVVGTGFGVALGFFLFPYVFPPPPAAETLTEADRTKLVASGNFIHVDPSDPIHWGEGKVNVYDGAVFLEPDFEVGPGPDYHVYLVPVATFAMPSRWRKRCMSISAACAPSREASAMPFRPAST